MRTKVARSWLDGIEVAAPCPTSWAKMEGDARVRFCGQCKLNVYNLSGMTREDATKLVGAAEGRMCVRFLRRADGTVLTEDCPVGLAARLRRRTLAVAGWFLTFAGLGSIFGFLFQKQSHVCVGIMKAPPLPVAPLQAGG
ncbi:MAG TPA: hypothetical protein VFF73_34290 [Planctomycetota bacterium]|nr:hypothetical protein [Planctomycetota bacterium]